MVERSLEFLNPLPRRRGVLHLFNEHSHSRLRRALPVCPPFPFTHLSLLTLPTVIFLPT